MRHSWWLITYWLIAVALDWSSTIAAHDWRVEETPMMRAIWRDYGDTGFTLTTILVAVIVSVAIYYGAKLRLGWLVVIGMVPMITFKILIALTNLVVIPYWVTGWY